MFLPPAHHRNLSLNRIQTTIKIKDKAKILKKGLPTGRIQHKLLLP